MSDLVIVALPRLDLTRPSIAPAILASIAKSQGLTVSMHDFALDLYNLSTKEEWNEYELYWQLDLHYELEDHLRLTLDKQFDNLIDRILTDNPKKIAVSVFSHNSINATDIFLEKIRGRTDAKIIIGGQGIPSKIENFPYADGLLKNNLIDYYCAGEAETTFAMALQDQTGPGVNNWQWNQLNSLDDAPIPDYSDYKLDEYHYLVTGKSLWINGSRGCVRRCDFCDIGKIWKKFRFRSGNSLANEIKHQINLGDTRTFEFADALINGSMKAFNDMTRALNEYIEKGDIHRPLFGGHFIVRPSNQMKPEHYKLAGNAGLDLVSIGVETGSDALRARMNKHFLNDDTAYHLEQCRKNNIQNLFLMFSGHPTETLEDHNQTLEMLKRFRYYVASGTISGLEVGSAAILEETPLAHWANENKIEYSVERKGDNRFWFNPANPTLTLKERIRRQLEIIETALDLGWPLNHAGTQLRYMHRLLLTEKERDEKYLCKQNCTTRARPDNKELSVR